MTEEEKKAIENAKEYVENEEILSVSTFDIKLLLNLIDKQQEKIQSLENQLAFIGEQNKYIEKLEKELHKQRKEIEDLKDVQQQICNEELLTQEYVQNNYIRKDEVLETIGYEKNSEEYKNLNKTTKNY